MQASIQYDTALRRLLQKLLVVRHAHLRPLQAIRVSDSDMALHYGQPGPCQAACGGLGGALRAVHAAGLWVGALVECVGLDETGRVVLSGVGSSWNLSDPFAGHPSTTGYDLRVGWRQRGDLLQLHDIEGALTRCA